MGPAITGKTHCGYSLQTLAAYKDQTTASLGIHYAHYALDKVVYSIYGLRSRPFNCMQDKHDVFTGNRSKVGTVHLLVLTVCVLS